MNYYDSFWDEKCFLKCTEIWAEYENSPRVIFFNVVDLKLKSKGSYCCNSHTKFFDSIYVIDEKFHTKDSQAFLPLKQKKSSWENQMNRGNNIGGYWHRNSNWIKLFVMHLRGLSANTHAVVSREAK